MQDNVKKILWLIFVPVDCHLYNVSVGVLHSCLNFFGHKQKIVTIPVPCNDFSFLVSEILYFDPDLVGINVYSFHRNQAIEVIDIIKKVGNYIVICGGPHVRVAPLDLLKHSRADFICNGEGEVALTKWVNSNYSETEGIIGRSAKNILSHTEPVNIDRLPYIDIALFGSSNIFEHGSWELYFKTKGFRRVLNTSFSRGCINICSTCCNKKITFPEKKRIDNNYRIKKMACLIKETRNLISKHKLDLIYFWDEHLPSLGYMEEFLAESKNNNISVVFSCLPHNLSLRHIDLLSQYKSPFIVFILISADSEMRQNLKFPSSTEEIRKKYRLLKESGISIISFVMINLPGETLKQAVNSYNFCRLESDSTKWVSYRPTPGTELFDCLVSNKKIKENAPELYYYRLYERYEGISCLTDKEFRGLTKKYDNLEIGSKKCKV